MIMHIWTVKQGDKVLGRFEYKSDALRSVRVTWSNTPSGIPEDVVVVAEEYEDGIHRGWTHL